LSIISGLLLPDGEQATKSAADNGQQHQQQQQQLHGAAIFSLFWSLGSFTNSVSRQKFTSLFWKLMGDNDGSIISNFDTLPRECHVYDWTFDVASCSWRPWSRDLPACNISPGSDPASIIVPTVNGLSHSYMLRLLLSAKTHVLFVGGTGTGKTVVVTRTLLEGLPDNWHNHMMSLSALSTANSVCKFLPSLHLCVIRHIHYLDRNYVTISPGPRLCRPSSRKAS
jgi:hypothetical protein